MGVWPVLTQVTNCHGLPHNFPCNDLLVKDVGHSCQGRCGERRARDQLGRGAGPGCGAQGGDDWGQGDSGSSGGSGSNESSGSLRTWSTAVRDLPWSAWGSFQVCWKRLGFGVRTAQERSVLGQGHTLLNNSHRANTGPNGPTPGPSTSLVENEFSGRNHVIGASSFRSLSW